ncbi:MAG TPA: hypothetical protein VGX25_27065 [Actinophytocola sp.]|uniref:hypothetical protein n=1 Tax=Actinophytocola sp. TaxID=1872138 RepID=UPI002DDDA933|nr:hypothetical protein [Actinophytocola sp.]HEV2783059.1 hypothetical protein [Actinophytocola sp.]
MTHSPQDLALLSELGALLRRCHPVPADVVAGARAAFAVAAGPPDWRWLERITDAPVPVRSGTPSFRFAGNDVRVQLELHRLPWRVRVIGLVTPVLDVEVRWPTGVRRVRPDDAGLFRVDDLPRGPLRLVIGETFATPWFGP